MLPNSIFDSNSKIKLHQITIGSQYVMTMIIVLFLLFSLLTMYFLLNKTLFWQRNHCTPIVFTGHKTIFFLMYYLKYVICRYIPY